MKQKDKALRLAEEIVKIGQSIIALSDSMCEECGCVRPSIKARHRSPHASLEGLRTQILETVAMEGLTIAQIAEAVGLPKGKVLGSLRALIRSGKVAKIRDGKDMKYAKV